MSPVTLDPEVVRRVVRDALCEDLGDRGDLTTDALIPTSKRGSARLIAREQLVVAGLTVAREVFLIIDRSVNFATTVEEGERVERGRSLATLTGPAGALLRGERTALNFLMRMCGIATAARAAVEEIEGTGARILDTRKTAPGLRAFDKYAVAVGGATNHRTGLYDAVMIKDTHLAIAGSVDAAVDRVLAAGHPPERVTVEVRSSGQLEEAIRAGARRALLDNMTDEELRTCVEIAGGRVVLEASGGLRPGNLRHVAETGVDFLSLGWLTHSAPAADLAMEMEPEGDG